MLWWIKSLVPQSNYFKNDYMHNHIYIYIYNILKSVVTSTQKQQWILHRTRITLGTQKPSKTWMVHNQVIENHIYIYIHLKQHCISNNHWIMILWPSPNMQLPYGSSPTFFLDVWLGDDILGVLYLREGSIWIHRASIQHTWWILNTCPPKKTYVQLVSTFYR